MKVRELIAELQQLDPELEVVLSSDEEGNSYEFVRGADSDAYAYTEEIGDGYVETLYAESEFEEDEDLDKSDFTQIVVIYS